MTHVLKVIKPIVLSLFSRREVKELVIALLERYSKTTDNTVDDSLVAMVKKALLKD
jgi:flagellar biosynthesis component FlhA